VEIKVWLMCKSQLFVRREMHVAMLQTERRNSTNNAWEGVFVGMKLASRISFLITARAVTFAIEEHPQN
jgi:hypothetical protein